MRVLLLSHSYPRFPTDPVGSFVLRLAVALRGQGIESLVLAPAGDGLAAREDFESVPVERFRYAPRRYETLAYTGTMQHQVRSAWSARFFMGTFLAAELWAALRVRHRFPAALVHAHWWFPGGLVGTWLRRLWKVPLVTTLHGSDLRSAQSSPFARRLFRAVLTSSDAVTTVSHWLASQTHALVPEVEPIVAPMPIMPGLFYPSTARDADRLLFVGKLNVQKGIEHLLRALSLMRARPTLDIVVGVGSSPDDVRPLAQSLSVADRLRWHPLLPQAELANLYRRCTAVVMPYVDEGLGLVAAEALLCETPVVAFASGGLTDIVLHERTGLLVRPGDAAALAVALDDLLSRPDRGAALGQAGRRHALSTFGAEAVAARYARIYESAHARRVS